MNAFQKLIKFSIFYVFSLTNFIFSDGFVVGTLIKTKNNYIPVEQLTVDDSVTSYDFKNRILVNDKIIKVHKEKINKVIQVTINDQLIEVAPNHKFYCPLEEKQWIRAKDLQVNQCVLRGISELLKINKINVIEKEVEVYTLSIKDNHNFFVSTQDIFVHNILFFGFAWVIGQGITWTGIGTAVTAVLTAVALNICTKKGILVDASLYNFKQPNENDLEHIFGAKNKKKHNFDGYDDAAIKALVKKTEEHIAEELTRGNIAKSGKFQTSMKVPTGDLIIRGIIIDKVIKIGTMYIVK